MSEEKMNDSNEAPLPKETIELEENNDLIICPKCSSIIEIISINEENNIIEYRCIKENKNYIKPIKEYLETIKAKKEKNIEELKDKCKIHKNKNYICYCFDCNNHLCNECLKTRNHINHRKSNIVEINPIEEEIEIIKEVIKYYKRELENKKLEKGNKTKEIDKLLNKDKRKENIKLEKEERMNKEKEKDELKKNNDNYIKDIEEIRKRYEEEIKKRKNKYEEDKNNIINKYKLINEKDKMKYKIKIEKINIKYMNEIKKYEFEKKIENIDNILKINEIIFNNYNNYNNNYYNSVNINSLLNYYIKNGYINEEIIKKKYKDKYNKLLEIIEKKKNEDKKKKEENERIGKEKIGIEEKYKNEINELKDKISQ